MFRIGNNDLNNPRLIEYAIAYCNTTETKIFIQGKYSFVLVVIIA